MHKDPCTHLTFDTRGQNDDLDAYGVHMQINLGVIRCMDPGRSCKFCIHSSFNSFFPPVGPAFMLACNEKHDID